MKLGKHLAVLAALTFSLGFGAQAASAADKDPIKIGVYLPLITTNCGVLGVTMNNISDGLNYVDSLLTALGCGLGFFLAMVIFSGVRSRVEDAEPPKSFEGLPITLVSASIVSLSFFGFSGVLDRLFGG